MKRLLLATVTLIALGSLPVQTATAGPYSWRPHYNTYNNWRNTPRYTQRNSYYYSPPSYYVQPYYYSAPYYYGGYGAPYYGYPNRTSFYYGPVAPRFSYQYQYWYGY